MPPTAQRLRLYQWGRESSGHGSAAAATSGIAIETLEPVESAPINRPTLATGYGIRTPGNEFVLERGITWKARGPFVYEQLQNWLGMGLVYAAAPTGSGPYVWTHAPSLAAVPTLASWTIERRRTDGSSPVDEEWNYCLATAIEISGSPSGRVEMAIEGIGRATASSTLTPGQSVPAIEAASNHVAKLYIDDDWAGLGGSQVAAQLLDWRVRILTGVKAKPTTDGRSTLDYATHVVDLAERGIEFEATVMSGAQMAIEKAKAQAAALRAMRLQIDGTSSRQLQLDMLLKHTAGSLIELGESDGQDTFTIRAMESTDGTNWLSAQVTNGVAALA